MAALELKATTDAVNEQLTERVLAAQREALVEVEAAAAAVAAAAAGEETREGGGGEKVPAAPAPSADAEDMRRILNQLPVYVGKAEHLIEMMGTLRSRVDRVSERVRELQKGGR